MEQIQEQSTQARLQGFEDRLAINSRYYRDQDPANITLAYFSDAVQEALHRPYFRDQLGDMLEARTDLEPAIALKTLERAYQADILRHEAESGYPDGFSKDRWLELFDTVENDMIRSGLVWLTLQHRHLQSNVAERYKSIKLITQLIADRFDGPPSHLDVGSSVMHGSLKLALNGEKNSQIFEFGDIDVMESVEPDSRKDRAVSAMANTALKQTVRFGDMVGLDITDIDDPYTAAWAKSCSFYPDELRDKTRVAEYAALEAADPDHQLVRKFVGDFANSDDFRKLRNEAPAEGFDIITFSTIFYQVSKQERMAMLVNAAQLLSDRGIIIIQDALDGNFSKLYNYVTLVRDSQYKNGNEDQELLRWRTPRCRQAVLGMGKLSVRNVAKDMKAALEDTTFRLR